VFILFKSTVYEIIFLSYFEKLRKKSFKRKLFELI